MPISHLLLALLVATIWGANFLFVKVGLQEMTPLLLGAARFLLASLPAIFFIKPPTVSFRLIALYGLVMFGLQFTFFFVGMHLGMTAGMASLIMQVQVFFSMLFAAFLLNEQPAIWQVVGALVSFLGIAIVGLHVDQNISFLGFLFILVAAASWGLGNLITKRIQKTNMVALVVWGSFVAAIPMTLLCLIFEGPSAIASSYQRLSWQGIGALVYIVYVSTWIGYGTWNWLISRYAVGTIVPFTLLVPIVGILSSVLVLNEPLHPWKLAACLLVLTGLAINLLGARLFTLKLRQEIAQVPEL